MDRNTLTLETGNEPFAAQAVLDVEWAAGALVKTIACGPGDVRIFALDGNRFRVVLDPKEPGLFIPMRTYDTSLSLEILELLISRCTYEWLCDAISRFDDSGYLAKILKRQLFAYFTPADFEGKRLLDFGCGSGTSSMIMAGCLPRTEIIGVELEDMRVDIARRIATLRRVPNVSFYTSPTPDSLPAEVGTCDFIMLSAVYEHLLPKERRALMPMLWSALKPGGTILINQTPCRWFPFEHHTTGLWWINYMPDFLACYVARHFSRESPETNRSLDWNGLLRHGVRGGTEREMLRNLSRGSDQKGLILQPTQGGFRDRAALWLSAASRRHAGAKKLIAGVFRVSDRLTGMVPASHVEVAIQKPRSKGHTVASHLGVLALRAYVGLLPKKPVGRLASVETYFNWQYQTSEKMFSTLPEFDFTNKRILEIGCGIGGRAAWLARNGAREVVGIDISFPDIRNAVQVKDKLHPDLKNVSYYTCEEDKQLTELGQFDIVLLLDSLEHVVSPLKVLRLAKKYTKLGGRVYFSNIGWFHHAGSHLGIPFATVFFSDETLLNLVRWQVSRPDYQPTDWDSDPPIAKWEGSYDLRDRPGEYLNKITIRQMKKLVRYAPYRRGRVIILGFRSAKVRWLNPLRHIPIINEVFHSAVVGMLDA